MRKFALFAAVMVAASVSSVAARAEYNYGPTKSGGLCWNVSPSGGPAQSFGFWGACPKTAAAPVAKHKHH